MSYTRSFKQLSRATQLGVLLIASVLASTLGLVTLFNTASASQITTFSDTASSSATSTVANHTLVWTNSSIITAAENITLQFTPGNSGGTNEFTLPSFATGTDVTLTGSASGIIPVRTTSGACAGGLDVYNSYVNNIAGQRIIQLTVCPTDSLIAQTFTMTLINNHVINPATTGSFVERLTAGPDSGDTRIAIIQTVTMSAIVSTSLSFTITGVASSTTLLGGLQTSTTTTATAIDFGTLGVGSQHIGAQLLTVSTNAVNGYNVTVQANQALTSSTGADINFFKDNSHLAAPGAWTAPLNTLGVNTTYGHFGVTSDDVVLATGNPFSGGTLYAGNFQTVPDGPRQIMYHNAAVNGTGIGVGTTTVAYRIEIGNLQEAANDYANVLTYVCTPVF